MDLDELIPQFIQKQKVLGITKILLKNNLEGLLVL